MKKRILPIATLFLISGILPACSNGQSGVDIETKTAIYTVTFNSCNGSEPTLVRKTGKMGDSIELPTLENYGGKEFAGWSKSYDKTAKCGDAKSLLPGKKYKIESSNVVLYAVYTKSSTPSHTSKEVEDYIKDLKKNSQANHLYYHYYRFEGDYSDWDVWAWSYKPDAGEGAKFDWASQIDNIGGAYVDIDLGATYDGGWDSKTRTMGGTNVSFAGATQIGLQIVKTSTRQTGGGFWVNDGSNLYAKLEDYAMEGDKGTSYHIFVVQDNVQNPATIPSTDNTDPFAEDDGTNTTYGNSQYDNVDWKTSATTGLETSSDFKKIGAGYQIMVSSFADSDGDGFGDIYGITQKLDYLEKLGVKALWLTPIQLSDSYHGYDITDYEKVDPKFGSSNSPAAKQAGEVTSETAMEDYKELIKQAHAKGMKIVMDLVLNHTSTSNKWFVSSANLDNDYRGYYQWGNHETNPTKINEDNNWYPYGDHPYSYYAKFGSSMPELNFSYKTTREAVEDMSVFWAKTIGVDGFRLDAVKHIYMENEVSSTAGDTLVYDKSESGDYSSDLTKNIHFFKELKSAVTKNSGKNVFFVGENFDGHAYHVAPYYEAFDSLFDFYSYFNLTSGAATARNNTTSGYGTVGGFLYNPGGSFSVNKDSQDTKAGIRDSGGIFAKVDGGIWDFPHVYENYNKYRNDVSMPGLFTSNHDIARVINRIAGSGGLTGLQAQGNVSVSNYASFEKSADCVKIAELMFPGLTWVYYGDEIGMTGNFPSNYDPKDVANIPYADLWYRQPMKWAQNGVKGDEYGTTDYYVTGSSMKVQQDEVNKSTAVKGAIEQSNATDSEFAILKKFIDLKNGNDAVGEALRIGSFERSEWVDGNLCSNVLTFTRKSGTATVKVIINFNNLTAPTNGQLTIRSGALAGTVLASYNGATQSSLPPYSAIVIKA